MNYMVRSTSPVIDVIGPLVEIKKEVSSKRVKAGESVTVTLTATNVGNRRTKASVKETVPSEAELVFGETELSRLLLPGESAALVYTISFREPGSFDISPTSVCYRDDDGTECTLESSRLRITVEDEEEPNSTSTADVEELGKAEEGRSLAPTGSGASSVGDDGGRGEGGGARKAGYFEEGDDPGEGSILWGLPALILIIFVAFDRYL